MFSTKALSRVCNLTLMATGVFGLGGVAFGQVPNNGTCDPVLPTNATVSLSEGGVMKYQLDDGTFDWSGLLTITFAQPSDIILIPTSHFDTNDLHDDNVGGNEQVAAWNFYTYFTEDDRFWVANSYTTDGEDWTYTPGTGIDMSSDQNGVQRYSLGYDEDGNSLLQGGDTGTVTLSNALWGSWGTAQTQTLTFNGNAGAFRICYYDQTAPVFTETEPTYYDAIWTSDDPADTFYQFHRNENVEGTLFQVQATDDSGEAVSYTMEPVNNYTDFNFDGSSGALSFKAPPDYENPGNASVQAADQSYLVEITAADGNGNSVTRAHVVYVFDTIVPSAPQQFVVLENNGAWDLTWKAPESDGASDYGVLADKGSAITGYQVSTDGGATFVDVDYTENGETYSTTLSSLGNGTVQDVRLRAKNDDYDDHVSGNYNDDNTYQVEDFATPIDPPGAPTGLTAVQGDTTLDLTWTAPESTGGSEITGYQISRDGGASFEYDIAVPTANSDGTLSHTLTDLPNGITADLQVRAGNLAGYGAATATYTLTPAAANPDGASSYNGVCEPILTSDPNVSLVGGNTPLSSDANGNYEFDAELEFQFSSELDLVLAPHESEINWNFTNQGSRYVTGGGKWIHTLGTAASITYSMSDDGTTIDGAQLDSDVANSAWGHFDTAGTTSVSLRPGGTDAFRLCRIPEIPEAPTDLTVVGGDKTLTVSWVEPLDDGGPDIGAYGISTDGGATFVNVAVTDLDTGVDQETGLRRYTYTLNSGLENGTDYEVRVRAENSVNPGTDVASGAGMPVGPPLEPTIDSVEASDGTLKIIFTPGSLEGGTFLKYEAAIDDEGFSQIAAETETEGATSLEITGLSNGTPYTVYLRTVSDISEGAPASSGPHTPAAAPGKPTIESIETSDTEFVVTFEPGTFGADAGFYSYQIATSADFNDAYFGEEFSEDQTSFTLTGLHGGTTYTVYLRMQNTSGVFSEADSMRASTTTSPPDTPTIDDVTSGNGALTVSFTPGDLNGGTFVRYEASVDGSFATGVVTSTVESDREITISGLEGGIDYYVYLRTVSNLATSPADESDATAAPNATAAADPTITSVAGGDGSLTITFEAGSLNGGDFERYEADVSGHFDPSSNNYVSTSNETATSLTIGNLDTYTEYRVYLRTVNTLVDGSEATSGAVESAAEYTAPSVPEAPAITGITAGHGSLTVAFTPGTLNSAEEDFLKFQAALDEDFEVGVVETDQFTTASTSLMLTGLFSDTTYTVYVRTVNAYGNSTLASLVSSPTAGAPDAPTIDSIAADGDGALTLHFTPGDFNGGTFVRYEASRDANFSTIAAESTDEDARSLTVSGLNGYTEYTLYLRTVTRDGETVYESSNSNSMTAVTSVSASAATSTLIASASSLFADGKSTLTLTLESRDVNGDRVTTGGNDVVFATSLGNISAAADAGDGTYSATLTSAKEVATAVVTATLNGASVTNRLEIDFTSDPYAVDTGGALASQGASLNVGGAFSAIVNAGTGGGLSSGSAGGGAAPASGGTSGASGSAGGGTSSTADAGVGGSGGEEVATRDPGDYGRLQVLSSRETTEGFSLVDWFTWGISDASVDAELKGDGTYGYAMIGSELVKTDRSVLGLLYGAESSRWNYQQETDVDRSGVSIGVYGGRRFGEIELSGSFILTASANDFTATSGATADADSTRFMLTASVRGEAETYDNGATLTPLFNLLFAQEDTDAFTYSDGTTSEAGTASVGKMSGGLEYMTKAHPTRGRYLVRGELGRVFGAETVTLSDGSEYTPNEDLAGSVTFGWLPTPTDDTQARIELTIGELGNGENEEIRLDGTWDRSY